jgi:hypothetical protein
VRFDPGGPPDSPLRERAWVSSRAGSVKGPSSNLPARRGPDSTNGADDAGHGNRCRHDPAGGTPAGGVRFSC